MYTLQVEGERERERDTDGEWVGWFVIEPLSYRHGIILGTQTLDTEGILSNPSSHPHPLIPPVTC